MSADAAGSRKIAEAEISGVREAERRSVAGEDVVQCAVRAHFSASSSRINASVGLWQFRVAAEHYLARVSYLLGCKWPEISLPSKPRISLHE